MDNFIITDFVNCFYARDKKGRRTEFQSRRAACFILTLSGRISFTAEKASFTTDATHAIFLPAGLHYVNECLEDAVSIVFNFFTNEQPLLPRTLPAIGTAKAQAYFETIRKASASLSPQSRMLIFRELYSLASDLFAEEKKTSAADAILKRAVEYMMENYADPSLTIDRIAAECFISEIYLRKLFAKKNSTTPFRMLTEIRMQKAYLLAKEKRPVGEIASAVGYGAVCQFSRAYKKHFGYPPSET